MYKNLKSKLIPVIAIGLLTLTACQSPLKVPDVKVVFEVSSDADKDKPKPEPKAE